MLRKYAIFTVYIFAFDRAVQYFDVTNKSSSYTVECVPEELEKKTTLLLYFARYMDEHLIQVSAMFLDETVLLKIWNELSVPFQEQNFKMYIWLFHFFDFSGRSCWAFQRLGRFLVWERLPEEVVQNLQSHCPLS